MIIALIDNGSLAPAAHRQLRAIAGALAQRCGVQVHAVSWKHSDRIPPETLGGAPAWALEPFVRAMVALGQAEFVFVPFFLSAQGAIGSALRADLERLRTELGQFDFTFTTGLAESGALTAIAVDRIRAVIATRSLRTPPVLVVDHGGPSPASAELRDRAAAEIRRQLGGEVSRVTAASMEGSHPPLLADSLRDDSFADRDVLVAPLFLLPGRHAGPGGDIESICRLSPTECHLADLIGTHPLALDALAAALQHTLSQHSAHVLA